MPRLEVEVENYEFSSSWHIDLMVALAIDIDLLVPSIPFQSSKVPVLMQCRPKTRRAGVCFSAGHRV